MEIGILETQYTNCCGNYGSTLNDSIILDFSKAKLLKYLNQAWIFEINIENFTEINLSPLTEVFSLVNISEVDLVDVLHTSRCIIFSG